MHIAAQVLLSLGVVLGAIAVGLLVHKVREDHLTPRTSLVVALACGVGLMAMVLTDWPVESMAAFWASHSVLASLLSSVLLVGLVFMVYEQAEHRRQEKLAIGLSGAGAGGLVDHLVDVEVALALVTMPQRPEELVPGWSGWARPGKPLRWLRESRELLDGGPSDPRTSLPNGSLMIDEDRAELVDQAIRRILAGMRDWTPLVGASSDGTTALLILSGIRSDLMRVHDHLTRGQIVTGDEIAPSITALRQRLRILAVVFEDWSGAPARRQEVMSTMSPLPDGPVNLGTMGRSLERRFDDAVADVGA